MLNARLGSHFRHGDTQTTRWLIRSYELVPSVKVDAKWFGNPIEIKRRRPTLASWSGQILRERPQHLKATDRSGTQSREIPASGLLELT